MRPMIHVQPTAELRRAFARWATEQRPKVRTVSTTAFAVPADLFAAAPEAILIGALVDGHRYVSPVEDAALGRPAPGASEPAPTPGDAADTAAADAVAPVAATPPDIVTEAMTAAPTAADVVAAAPAADDARADNQAAETQGVFPCPRCDKELTTARGRDMHARKVHGVGVEE